MIGTNATFRIGLEGGNCFGVEGLYSFYEQHIGNPTLGPVTWTLSPNPTNNLLQINPVISPNVDATTVPEAMEMWLFSPNASLEVHQQGSTKTASNLDMTRLTPGNYTLQLLYGTYLEQFTVVKAIRFRASKQLTDNNKSGEMSNCPFPRLRTPNVQIQN